MNKIQKKNVLITGGCGFVGSSLAKMLRQEGQWDQIICFDNLKRKGSERNINILTALGINFYHGDVRNPTDFEGIDVPIELIIDAAAEPSVLAGLNGSPNYLIQTNLVGTFNVLEFARKNKSAVLFLSTSRVYSIEALKQIPLQEDLQRFTFNDHFLTTPLTGVNSLGISEEFETKKPRSLYGASKLASEYLAQEYHFLYNIPIIINRCGVIAGAGQFGKVDQGVFTLWVANHFFGKPLQYNGFGGNGKQVRDLLDPKDLFELIKLQSADFSTWKAQVYNVGGGIEGAISLSELTSLCQDLTQNKVDIHSHEHTNIVDIPWYVTNNMKVQQDFGWNPKSSPKKIINNIYQWINENQHELKNIFT